MPMIARILAVNETGSIMIFVIASNSQRCVWASSIFLGATKCAFAVKAKEL